MAFRALPQQFCVVVDVFRGEAKAAALSGELLHLFDGVSRLFVTIAALGAPRTRRDGSGNSWPPMAFRALPEQFGVVVDVLRGEAVPAALMG